MKYLLIVLAAVAATFFYRRLRRRRAARTAGRSVDDLPAGVEISLADFNAMMADMEEGPMGDGRDEKGRPFTIIRYRSRATGKLYDYVGGADGARVIEYPAPVATPSA